MNNGVLPYIIIATFVLFVIFRRARGLFTLQKVSPEWLALRLDIFGLLGLLALAIALTDSLALAGDLVGLIAGAVVAYFGLRLTTFESRLDGLYFKPNLYVGVGVFAICLVRLAYRFIESFAATQSIAQQANSGAGINLASQFAGDPLTGAAYFLLIGYYVFYYVMLILRSRQSTATS